MASLASEAERGVEDLSAVSERLSKRERRRARRDASRAGSFLGRVG